MKLFMVDNVQIIISRSILCEYLPSKKKRLSHYQLLPLRAMFALFSRFCLTSVRCFRRFSIWHSPSLCMKRSKAQNRTLDLFCCFSLHADHSSHKTGTDSIHQHKAADLATEQDTQCEHPEGARQVVMLWEEP